MVVTSSRGQFIRTLGGRPAMDVLHELIEASSESDRKQISTGLLLGRVINEYKDHFGRSDYLLRGVVGVMKQDKAIAIAEPVRVGQTVRFHVRDAATAREDLAMLMDAQAIHDKPIGALLFTCNGRGTRLFPHPHHDASLIQHAFNDPVPGEVRAKAGSAVQAWPRVPLAGFFAAGEIGPIGDEVFLHTQTASAVFFR
jgi:small ligand-binding sensory domain FIST